jgi:hypothetical protein
MTLRYPARHSREIPAGKLALWLALATVAFAGSSSAETASLIGSWRGSGAVSFASGAREAAKCHAQYSRASSTSYILRATCATPSGRATQTATLHHVGGNNYQGSFHNSEFDVSGTIRVTLAGNRQTVRLTGDAGSGLFELRR